MMKYYIKITVRFMLLQLFVFVSMFAYLFFVNLLPVVSCAPSVADLMDVGCSILLPSFCVSFLNSFLISLFLYGFLIVDHEHSCLFSVKIVPFFISLLFFIIIFCLLHPKVINSSVHYSGNDARFFVDAGVFFQYYREPKERISSEDFLILQNKAGKKDLQLLRKSYSRKGPGDLQNGDFSLGSQLLPTIRLQLKKYFSQSGETENIKMFFGRVEREMLYDVIISLPDQILSFESLPVSFPTSDKMQFSVSLDGNTEECFFFEEKQHAMFSNSRYAFAAALVYNNNGMILPFFNMSLLVSIGIWMVITLLILTVSGWIYFKEYPLVSVVLNFLLLLAFYFFMPSLLHGYRELIKNFASESFVRLRYVIFFFISSGILFVINIMRWLSYKAALKE